MLYEFKSPSGKVVGCVNLRMVVGWLDSEPPSRLFHVHILGGSPFFVDPIHLHDDAIDEFKLQWKEMMQ